VKYADIGWNDLIDNKVCNDLRDPHEL